VCGALENGFSGGSRVASAVDKMWVGLTAQGDVLQNTAVLLLNNKRNRC